MDKANDVIGIKAGQKINAPLILNNWKLFSNVIFNFEEKVK